MKSFLFMAFLALPVILIAVASAPMQPRAHVQEIPKTELLGQFDPAAHPDFVRIEAVYTAKKDIYLRKQAYDSLVQMIGAARAEGIALTVVSATRNFDYQKGIWQRKWSSDKFKVHASCERARQILRYSSMPGTSRHHWGTDIDLNAVEPAYFASGKGKKEYEWLVRRAPDFGFHQTYTAKNNNSRTGFEEEKWHWSFMPLAGPFLREFNRQVTYEDFTGFDGSACARELRVIEDYVNGIDSLLLNAMK